MSVQSYLAMNGRAFYTPKSYGTTAMYLDGAELCDTAINNRHMVSILQKCSARKTDIKYTCKLG